jgi:hypothetical protein
MAGQRDVGFDWYLPRLDVNFGFEIKPRMWPVESESGVARKVRFAEPSSCYLLVLGVRDVCIRFSRPGGEVTGR